MDPESPNHVTENQKDDIDDNFEKHRDQKETASSACAIAINHPFLLLYVLTLASNTICVAWTTGGNN